MAIIKLPDDNSRGRFQRISDAGRALGELGRQASQNMLSLGRQLTAAGQAYFKEANQAEAEQQYNRAMTEATLEFNKQYLGRAQQVRDQDGNPTYGTLVDDVGGYGQEIMTKISQSITNPAARSKFEANFARLVGNKQISAFGQARRQQLDFGKATLYDSVELQSEQALADSPEQLNHYRAVIGDSIDDALSAGLLSEVEHRSLKEKTLNNLNTRVYSNFIRTNPTAASEYFNNTSAKELGVDADIHERLKDNAEAAIKSQERALKRIEAEQARAQASEQSQRYDQLHLDIVDGKDNETEIRSALTNKQITTKHAASLLKKLKTAQKSRDKDLKAFKEIDSAIENQTAIKASSTTVNKHYTNAVGLSTKDDSQPLSLSQKAVIASRYTRPVTAFQDDVEVAALSEDTGRNADALQAYRFAEDNSPYATKGMDKKSRAVLEVARTLSDTTSLDDVEAMKIAKQRVLETDENILKERRSAYRKIEAFSDENLESTVKEMFDAEGFFFGLFGGANVPTEMKGEMKSLLQEAYMLTGEEKSAKNLVKSWTKNLYGTTEVNGQKELTMLPVSKAYPGMTDQQARTQLETQIAEIRPELDASSVKIEADMLSRVGNKVTYQVYQDQDIGGGVTIKMPVLDENNEPLRWSPDGVESVDEFTGRASSEVAQEVIDQTRIEEARELRQRVEQQQTANIENFENRRRPFGIMPISEKLKQNFSPEKIKVLNVIERASERVGVDSAHMAAIAQVESALKPNAKARTSSASGLFQFIRSTWRTMVKRYGKQYGIGINDRFDPEANAIMGGLLLKENARKLKNVLGREPDIRELYLAHFSGIGKAIRVIRELQRNPHTPVGNLYSAAEIRANRSILKGTLHESFLRLTNKVVRAHKRVAE